MKAGDIRPCAICHKGVMHTGLPLFWRVTCKRMGIDRTAVNQVAGLEMMTGNVAIARILSPDPDIATPLGEARTVLVCETCAAEPTTIYAIGLEG